MRLPERSDGEPGEGVVAASEATPSPGALRAPPSPARGEGTSRPMRATRHDAAAAASPQKHLLRRRRRPVDLRLARRRGRQHPALRARLPRRQGHPPGAQLPLDRPYPRRRLASDRPQRRPARQDAAHRGRAGREGHRHRVLGSEEEARAIGEEIEQLQRGFEEAPAEARTSSTRSPSWCAPRSRCASSRTASSRSACPIA